MRSLLHRTKRGLTLLFHSIRLRLWRITSNTQSVAGSDLCQTCIALGPTFIKLGQILSSRPDLIGYERAQALSILQDQLPAAPIHLIEQSIQSALGGPLSQYFSQFDPIPVGAASIAQVHHAILINGEHVAVKVLRPNIEQELKRDLGLLLWLARLFTFFMPRHKRLKLVEVVELLKKTTLLETDLRLEAAAADELRQQHKNNKSIYIPKVYWNNTTQKILTLEWLEGKPIRSSINILSHEQRRQLAQDFAVHFFQQAYQYGFFHADLHPGNILILEDGRLALIDFGITGRLSEQTKRYVARILKGFLERDYAEVARVHFAAGYVSNNHCPGLFSQACRAIGEPIFGQQAQHISIAKLLIHLFKVTEDFDMETQPQLLLLQKSLVLVEAIGTLIDPEVNLWQLAAPWMQEWGKRHLSLEAEISRHVKEYILNKWIHRSI
jgi:ubiquinone biosynthesis protein